MKRVFLFVVACALCCGAPVRAQQVFKRVEFPRGGTTAVLEGRTNSSSSVVYQLRARAGQYMTVQLTSPKNDVMCQIHPVNGHLLTGGAGVTRWQGNLPKDGEYEILVFILYDSDTYTLEVTLSPGASGQGGAPGSDERASDPSPPAQPKAAVGANDGYYVLKENAPRGFKGFVGFDLTTADFRRPTRPVPVKPNGIVYAGPKYRMTSISIDGDHFSFETASVAGASYRFDGTFLHPKNPDAPMLEGLLTRILNGKTVAEARVKLFIEETGGD